MPLPFLIGGLLAAAGSIGATAAAGAAAVGATAAGAMGVVGTAVGTAAAAASAAPIIGGAAATVATITTTSAGAAAVGTIATAGAIGAASGVSGTKKLAEASEIKEEANSRYRSKKREFEQIQSGTNKTLESLGKKKAEIWQSFERFSNMFSKIQNPPIMEGETKTESLSLSADDLKYIKAVALTAKDLLTGGTASVVAGNLIGIAATGGIVNTLAVASTGTAVSALSGAAATNAAMAALGGGALSAGGLGMAGGAVVAGGLVAAPMLAVGGLFLNHKGSEALDNAYDISIEVDQAISTMKRSEAELRKVQALAEKIGNELEALDRLYCAFMNEMERIVSEKTDYAKFTSEEKHTLEKTILTLKLLKQVSMQNILSQEDRKTILGAEVDETVNHSRTTRLERIAS